MAILDLVWFNNLRALCFSITTLDFSHTPIHVSQVEGDKKEHSSGASVGAGEGAAELGASVGPGVGTGEGACVRDRGAVGATVGAPVGSGERAAVVGASDGLGIGAEEGACDLAVAMGDGFGVDVGVVDRPRSTVCVG